MSVIIRLQNLAWSANALDIRQFFRGLSIPEGGVHIVGGELGDAFIAFSTDEDARQAMMQDGGKIQEVKIKLFLSSRTEMQKVIETARQQTLQSFMQNSGVNLAQNIPLNQQQQQLPQENQQQKQFNHNNNRNLNNQQQSSLLGELGHLEQQEKAASPFDRRDNDSEYGGKDRKDRRDRSRSKDRDRDRDRRDRGRDRRRRDRSRSRERDRDRRDRFRRSRRDRSRSRDRTRSRDRDGKRNSNDRRKDNQDDDNNDVVCVGQFLKDKFASSSSSLGMKNKKKQVGINQNGIWEVPPQSQNQSQLQTMILAPNILGSGVAALNPGIDSDRFNPSLLHSNAFNLNAIQSHVINPLNLNNMPPALTSLPSLTSLGRDHDRQQQSSWSNDQPPPPPPPRLGDLKFPVRPTLFSSTSDNNNFGFNSNSNFRHNNIRNNQSMLLNKMQELDGRRNPNAFQSNSNQFMNRNNFGRNNNFGNNRFSSGDASNLKMTGCCVEVRNMPLNASYSDVRHAFSGLFIRKDGLKLINDTHGNRVGIAYVKFSKMEGKEMALNTPRYVKGSEVEVCHIDESLFDKAIDSYVPNRNEINPEIAALITSAITAPIVTSAPTLAASPTSILSSSPPPLSLPSPSALLTAITSSSPSSSTAVTTTTAAAASTTTTAETNQCEISNSCVVIDELPSFAKEVDIAKAFQDWKINDLFITSTKKDNGSVYYTAYVQFTKSEDAKVVSNLTTLKIGPKNITANVIPDDKFHQAKKSYEQDSNYNHNQNNSNNSHHHQNHHNPNHRNQYPNFNHNFNHNQHSNEMNDFNCVFMKCLPFQTGDRDILDFYSDIGIIPRRIHMMLNINGSKAGECFCEFDSSEEAIRAMEKNGLPLGKNNIIIELITRNKMLDTLNNPDAQLDSQNNQNNNSFMNDRPRSNNRYGFNSSRGGNGSAPPLSLALPPPPGLMSLVPGRHMQNSNHNHPRHPPVDYVEGFGKPGCVVSLENVPFKADISEIIEFFNDFDVKRENIIRRYNDRGMPTGDAKVAFSSPSEAQRAVRELRNRKVRDRTIYIKLS